MLQWVFLAKQNGAAVHAAGVARWRECSEGRRLFQEHYSVAAADIEVALGPSIGPV